MPIVRGTRYAMISRGASGVVNTAPTITVPGAQSATSNVDLAITGTSIADPESQNQTISISVSHGTFSLASTTGLSFSVGDGTADASMTFSGTLANVNTAIASLSYTSTSNYEGSDSLVVNATDSAGGAATQKTVAITVTWNPLSLGSNLVMWLDPSYGTYTDDGVTAANSGDVVKRWVSRNNASLYVSQATLGNRPSLATGGNSKLSMVSSGSKWLDVSNALGVFPTGNASRSLAIGCNRTASISQEYVFALGTVASNQMWVLDVGTGSNIRIAAVGNNYASTFSTTNNQWMIVDVTYDGTTISIRKDASGTPYSATATAFNTTYGNAGPFAAYPGGSLPFTGNISNIILTNHKLTSTELGLAYAYVLANQPT